MGVMEDWKPASVLAAQIGKAVIAELAYAGDGRTLIVKGDLLGFDDLGVTLLLEATPPKWSVIPWHRIQTIQADPEIQE